MKRRRFLAIAAAGAAFPALAQQPPSRYNWQPAQDITPMIAKITGGATPEPGGVLVELPTLAENGNTVPMHVRVDSPMTPQDHVRAVHVFAERNPRPLVATFRFGPQSGRAEVTTRVRLAGTQKVTVLAALSDGRFRIAQAEVHVTSAACLDESL
jgi:sulfur-oxidizing protein SoxY